MKRILKEMGILVSFRSVLKLDSRQAICRTDGTPIFIWFLVQHHMEYERMLEHAHILRQGFSHNMFQNETVLQDRVTSCDELVD